MNCVHGAGWEQTYETPGRGGRSAAVQKRMKLRRGSDRQLFLRRGVDIERAKRMGRRVPTSSFNMVVAAAHALPTKIAVIVGRKFGPATRRNRAKRRIRELSRSVEERLVDHYHVLIFPKAPVVNLPYAELAQVWVRLFAREGLLRD